MAATSTHDQSVTIEEAVPISSLFKEADESPLLDKEAESELGAYNLYNNYACKIGFGVRYSRIRRRESGFLKGREFCCDKQGFKNKNRLGRNLYMKKDRRTGCKAMIYFDLKASGKWVAARHIMEHNHPFCPQDQIHQVRSHRNVITERASPPRKKRYVDDGDRLLSDVCNPLAKESNKRLEGSDANRLLNMFTRRQASEPDFYFACELDDNSSLISVFWRDKKMKDDYMAFGDLLVHDTAYRTKKYDMICAPFVGMNHHTHNCMFGCGFILNERIESFEWLLEKFLHSMDGVHPKTVMTDQSYSMAAAIEKVFPESKHRLCVWHIGENSRLQLSDLRELNGFDDLFNHVLKKCHTLEEFDHYWRRMGTEFKCGDHPWLLTLHELRKKWSRAFSKNDFSGGALSSQICESTNNSVFRRLARAASLCDFYNCFCEVVSEWRSNEKRDNGRCFESFPKIVVPHLSILLHASRVYTIDAYDRFQKEFVKSMSYKQELQSSSDSKMVYLVWRHEEDIFGQIVTYDPSNHLVCCTCKRFEETGFLCRHILRIFFINCVDNIPDNYVLKRWTREAKPRDVEEGSSSGASGDGVIVNASHWRIQMQKKVHQLLCASELNVNARRICEEWFDKCRANVESEVGSIYVSDSEIATSEQ